MISIYEYGAVPNDRIFARQDPVSDVRDAVAEILVTVQRDGDAALRNYAQRFDHASLTALEVSPAEIDDAMAQISPVCSKTAYNRPGTVPKLCKLPCKQKACPAPVAVQNQYFPFWKGCISVYFSIWHVYGSFYMTVHIGLFFSQIYDQRVPSAHIIIQHFCRNRFHRKHGRLLFVISYDIRDRCATV